MQKALDPASLNNGANQREGACPISISLGWLEELKMGDGDGLRKVKEEAKVRTRIRSRLVDTTDWRQELEELEPETNKPLMSAEDILQIRHNAWIPDGVFMPKTEDLTLGYDTAWDIGKRGCVAYKLSGDFDLRIGPNKMRFFVMDGTSEEAFLTYYTKPDVLVEKGEVSERKGAIKLCDMRDGFWNYKKKKVRITRTGPSGGVRVLENFPERFFDAMLVCLREAEIQRRTAQLRAARLANRREDIWKQYLIRRQRKDVQTGRQGGRPSVSGGLSKAAQTGTGRHTVTDIPRFEAVIEDATDRQRCSSESHHAKILIPHPPRQKRLSSRIEATIDGSRSHSSSASTTESFVHRTSEELPSGALNLTLNMSLQLPSISEMTPEQVDHAVCTSHDRSSVSTDLILDGSYAAAGQSIYLTKPSDVDYSETNLTA